MNRMRVVHSETQIPLGWVLSGAGALVVGLITVGLYIGSLSAQANNNSRRIEDLEDIIPRIDRRLARMEGAAHVEAPKEERFSKPRN